MKTIKDKQFVPLIPKDVLTAQIKLLAKTLEKDYLGKDPLFVGILNGSFMFLSELFKNISINCEVSFIKVHSYEKMHSTGHVKKLIGLNENITDRHVVIVEDIIDTGNTMKAILPVFQKQKPASLKILTLLHKKDAT
ncbi:MAG: hypoxanthine phosphoribosyltransferase, partial [Arcticibacterium sp.]